MKAPMTMNTCTHLSMWRWQSCVSNRRSCLYTFRRIHFYTSKGILRRMSFSKSSISTRNHLIIHCGPEQPRIQTEVLGHLLVHSLDCSHCSLIRLLLTTYFARALHCARSFARSLTSFTLKKKLPVGQWSIWWLFILCFFSVLARSEIVTSCNTT